MAVQVPASCTYPEFDRNAPDASVRWNKYLARFKVMMTAFGIVDPEQKINLLLHYGGEDLYDTYMRIPEGERQARAAAEGIPAQNVFERGMEALTEKFAPQQDANFHVFEFRKMKQGASETLDQYLSRLTNLAARCNFHDNDYEIKFQIITEGRDPKLRRKGLTERNWTLQQLCEYGRALEKSELQAHSMENGTVEEVCERTEKVLKVSSSQRSQAQWKNSRGRPKDGSPKCIRCGGIHYANECPHKDVQCFRCAEIGHFADFCFNRPLRQRARSKSPAEGMCETCGRSPSRDSSPISRSRRGNRRRRDDKTNYMEEDSDEDLGEVHFVTVENDTENWGAMCNHLRYTPVEPENCSVPRRVQEHEEVKKPPDKFDLMY